MLERSHKLRQVSTSLSTSWILSDMRYPQAIGLFLRSADTLYGPITTIRRNGHIEKKIPWSAFSLSERDWERVADVRDLLKVSLAILHNEELTMYLQDSNDIQQLFSTEEHPTLWRALPALEELQTAWEEKRTSVRYILLRSAIDAGLAKLRKYYSRMDAKPVFVLALGTCPCLFQCFALSH
jgi:hypothetical protein